MFNIIAVLKYNTLLVKKSSLLKLVYEICQDSKFPVRGVILKKVLLRIITDLSNAVVLIVSPRPDISTSSSPGTNPLVTVPRTPITITFMFHSFSVL